MDTPPAESPALLVSAILVVHNQAPQLRLAIEALERSKPRETLEILVVDCGSMDQTPDLAEAYPGINMLRLPHHFGATKALNIATRTAKADLVFYVSPNVEVAPDTIARLTGKLDDEGDAAAVCPLLVDRAGQAVSRKRPLPNRESLAAVCKGGELPTTALDTSEEYVPLDYPGRDAILVQKRLIRGMNYLDERFGEYWADADMAAQIKRAGKKIRLYPAIRAVYTPAPDPLEDDPVAQGDKIAGAAAFVGKYDGFLAGLTFRVSAALRALFSFQFGRFMSVLSGQKLDGSQSGP